MKKASEQQASKFAGVFVEHHQLLTNAPSSDLQWAIQNPEDAIRLFVDGLVARGKQIIMAVKKVLLTPWKTIDLGGTTTEMLLKTIEEPDDAASKEKNEVSNWARDLTTKPAFTIAEKPEKADLVILTPADLGFTEMPRTDQFLTKEFLAKWSAEHLDGYVIELCSPEVGPQLRLQYQDQPKGEVLWIAMERITDSAGDPRVFYVERDGGGERWLFTPWTDPSDLWYLDNRIVFRLRKITQPSVA